MGVMPGEGLTSCRTPLRWQEVTAKKQLAAMGEYDNY